MQCHPKKCAADLLRWALAILFILMGVNKFIMGISVVADGTAQMFSTTWFPEQIASVFLYIVPFLEVLLGVLLATGWKRCMVLGATGVLLIIFLGGHLIGQIPGEEKVVLLILVNAIALKMCSCIECGECLSCNNGCCEEKGMDKKMKK